jgi:hypothetical protein
VELGGHLLNTAFVEVDAADNVGVLGPNMPE